MKADFFAANELEEVVRRQANEWKTLSFTKKSKMTNFWSKAVQKLYQKWQMCHSLLHVKKQLKEQKTNTQTSKKHLFLPPIMQLLPILKRKLNKKSAPKTSRLISETIPLTTRTSDRKEIISREGTLYQ